MPSHGASITAPDGLRYGDTFMPTWTPPQNYIQKDNTYLFASMDIWQNGVLVNSGNYVNLDGLIPANAGPFILSGGIWQGGAATGKLYLWTLDAGSGRRKDYAVDDFEIAA